MVLSRELQDEMGNNVIFNLIMDANSGQLVSQRYHVKRRYMIGVGSNQLPSLPSHVSSQLGKTSSAERQFSPGLNLLGGTVWTRQDVLLGTILA